MNFLDSLKELLKGRNTTEINAFITKNPIALDEMDENGISGLMYIGYHQLPESLAFAIDQKKTFTLHEAAAMGLLHQVITKVNSKPSSLNMPAKDGFLPLTLACFFGQGTVVNYLLKKGAKVNIPATNPTKVMPLHSAVAHNDFDICEQLIQYGADVNAKQTQGVTPLMSAAHRGNVALVKLLVENGAYIDAEMEEGKTALAYAQQDEHQAVIDYLQLAGKENYDLPLFGNVSLAAVAGSYEVDIEIKEIPLSIDLNFEKAQTNKTQLALFEKVIDHLMEYIERTRAEILKDAKDEDGIVEEYLAFHIEELEEAALKEVLAKTTSARKKRKKLLKMLQLVRIGFYPQDDQNYAVFDYTLGRNLTDLLLVVVINKEDEIALITMES